ncbi:MAG: DNA repair protein RadC, partial [Candidatus Aenigmarchaeota archaeon]|nr:DNA repair protein RadC [Candidatus Aenigmarchaeota archaeon]
YLDTKNRIIRDEIVSVGTLNSSLVHPREIFKGAIKESANAIILVHNHPSGDPTPSEEDKEVTKRLSDAGELLSINMLDHVIVGADEFYSFEENK